MSDLQSCDQASTPASADDGPLVSVIVPTRNRPELLRRCLDAIAAQTYQAYEVLVCDDGSSEATLEAYQGIAEGRERVRWLLSEHPGLPGTGPAATRNRGIRAARGAFVAFCDDDDTWTREDHLATAVLALVGSGAGFYFSDFISTRDGQVSSHVWFPELHLLRRGPRVLSRPQVFSADLATVLRVVAGSAVHLDCWVVRRTILEATGGFWERLWFAEDYDLMMRVLDQCDTVLFRADPCAEYRLPNGDSVSLQSSPLDTLLQDRLAAEHVRMTCRNPIVRRHARARQAYGLRRLGRRHRAIGNRVEGARLAWEGLWTYPTLGALHEYLIGSIRSRGDD